MRRDGTGRGGRPRDADINITPVVDVMLVLLVIFMVTAPMMAAGLHVDLPKAGAARPMEARDPVVVTLGRDGRTMVGSDIVTEDDLAALVKMRIGEDTARSVRLAADGDVSYARVVATLDRLVAAGVKRVGVATKPHSPVPRRD